MWNGPLTERVHLHRLVRVPWKFPLGLPCLSGFGLSIGSLRDLGCLVFGGVIRDIPVWPLAVLRG